MQLILTDAAEEDCLHRPSPFVVLAYSEPETALESPESIYTSPSEAEEIIFPSIHSTHTQASLLSYKPQTTLNLTFQLKH